LSGGLFKSDAIDAVWRVLAPFVLDEEDPDPFNRFSLLNDGDVDGVVGRLDSVC
jgi:hypothetical protein